MRFHAVVLTIPAGLLLSALGLAAQPAPPPDERADPQRPGLPPPYYSYAYGPETTEHRSLTVEQAIALALQTASSYRQAQFDERLAAEDVTQARAALLPTLAAQIGYVGTTPAGGLPPGERVDPELRAGQRRPRDERPPDGHRGGRSLRATPRASATEPRAPGRGPCRGRGGAARPRPGHRRRLLRPLPRAAAAANRRRDAVPGRELRRPDPSHGRGRTGGGDRDVPGEGRGAAAAG